MESWRRKVFCAVFTLFLLFLLCSCGRTGSLSADNPQNADGSSNPVKSAGSGQTSESTAQVEKTEKPLNDATGRNGVDKNNVTSLEAVRIAYAEAIKWNPNAVLWFINPTDMFLHYDWTQSDKAMSWTIGFANPDNDEEVQVYVRDGKVNPIGGNPVDNVGNKRKVECKPEYPKDSPKISMKEAAQVAIANGAPAGVMPVNVSYDTESFGKAGSPLWMIVYSLPLPTDPQKQEMHFYYVDGLTGKFVEAGYKADGEIVTRDKLMINGPDYASSTVWMDQTIMIVRFLTLVNEGKTADAVAMLDKTLTADAKAKEVWINTLDCIKGFQIEYVTEDNKENWTPDRQMFEVDLIIPANKDLQKYGWQEGKNTRYVTLKRLDNSWVIEAFAFQ